MMTLVAFLDTTQDRDTACLVGLIDHDGLEATLQCFIFFKILLILIKRGGTDRAQLATCKGRFQDVGGVHGTRTIGTSPHKRMDLINEEDTFASRLYDIVHHSFEALFKLTLILGTCYERTHIKRVDLFALEVLRHIATQDTMSKALHNGCLTRTGLTYQYRIILGATAKNLQYATNLLIATYHGVELTALCRLVEIDGKAVQEAILLVLIVCKVTVHS